MNNSDNIPSLESIAFGNFVLFPAARLLEFKGVPVTVGSRAIEILSLLLERTGMVVCKRDLIARAWPHVTVDESGLKVQIASLRKILQDGQNGNRYIVTVSGRGYSFVAPTERTELALHSRLASVPHVPMHQMSIRFSTIQNDKSMLRNPSTNSTEYRFVAIRKIVAPCNDVGATALVEQIAASLENGAQILGQNDNNSARHVSGVRDRAISAIPLKHSKDHGIAQPALAITQEKQCSEPTW